MPQMIVLCRPKMENSWNLLRHLRRITSTIDTISTIINALFINTCSYPRHLLNIYSSSTMTLLLLLFIMAILVPITPPLPFFPLQRPADTLTAVKRSEPYSDSEGQSRPSSSIFPFIKSSTLPKFSNFLVFAVAGPAVVATYDYGPYISEYSQVCGATTYADAINLCNSYNNGEWFIASFPTRQGCIAIAGGVSTSLSSWLGADDIASEGAWRWADGRLAGMQFWSGLAPGGSCVSITYPLSHLARGASTTATAAPLSQTIFNTCLVAPGDWTLNNGGGGPVENCLGYSFSAGRVQDVVCSGTQTCHICERSQCNTKSDCFGTDTISVSGYYPNCNCTCSGGRWGPYCQFPVTVNNTAYISEYSFECGNSKNGAQAAATCSAKGNGWHLATFPTLASFTAFRNVLQTTSSVKLNYLGTNDAATEGRFVWSHGRLAGSEWYRRTSVSAQECRSYQLTTTALTQSAANAGSGITQPWVDFGTTADCLTYWGRSSGPDSSGIQDCVAFDPAFSMKMEDFGCSSTSDVGCVACERTYCALGTDCILPNSVSASGFWPTCTCGCALGYSGAICEVRSCHIQVDCVLANTVSMSGTYPSCQCTCKLGYGGKRCSHLVTKTPSLTLTQTASVTVTASGSNSVTQSQSLTLSLSMTLSASTLVTVSATRLKTASVTASHTLSLSRSKVSPSISSSDLTTATASLGVSDSKSSLNSRTGSISIKRSFSSTPAIAITVSRTIKGSTSLSASETFPISLTVHYVPARTASNSTSHTVSTSIPGSTTETLDATRTATKPHSFSVTSVQSKSHSISQSNTGSVSLSKSLETQASAHSRTYSNRVSSTVSPSASLTLSRTMSKSASDETPSTSPTTSLTRTMSKSASDETPSTSPTTSLTPSHGGISKTITEESSYTLSHAHTPIQPPTRSAAILATRTATVNRTATQTLVVVPTTAPAVPTVVISPEPIQALCPSGSLAFYNGYTNDTQSVNTTANATSIVITTRRPTSRPTDKMIREGTLELEIVIGTANVSFKKAQIILDIADTESVLSDPRSLPSLFDLTKMKCKLGASEIVYVGHDGNIIDNYIAPMQTQSNSSNLTITGLAAYSYNATRRIFCTFPATPAYKLSGSEQLRVYVPTVATTRSCPSDRWLVGTLLVQPESSSTVAEAISAAFTVVLTVVTTVMMVIGDGTAVEMQAMVLLFSSAMASTEDIDSVAVVRHFLSPVFPNPKAGYILLCNISMVLVLAVAHFLWFRHILNRNFEVAKRLLAREWRVLQGRRKTSQRLQRGSTARYSDEEGDESFMRDFGVNEVDQEHEEELSAIYEALAHHAASYTMFPSLPLVIAQMLYIGICAATIAIFRDAVEISKVYGGDASHVDSYYSLASDPSSFMSLPRDTTQDMSIGAVRGRVAAGVAGVIYMLGLPVLFIFLMRLGRGVHFRFYEFNSASNFSSRRASMGRAVMQVYWLRRKDRLGLDTYAAAEGQKAAEGAAMNNKNGPASLFDNSSSLRTNIAIKSAVIRALVPVGRWLPSQRVSPFASIFASLYPGLELWTLFPFVMALGYSFVFVVGPMWKELEAMYILAAMLGVVAVVTLLLIQPYRSQATTALTALAYLSLSMLAVSQILVSRYGTVTTDDSSSSSSTTSTSDGQLSVTLPPEWPMKVKQLFTFLIIIFVAVRTIHFVVLLVFDSWLWQKIVSRNEQMEAYAPKESSGLQISYRRSRPEADDGEKPLSLDFPRFAAISVRRVSDSRGSLSDFRVKDRFAPLPEGHVEGNNKKAHHQGHTPSTTYDSSSSTGEERKDDGIKVQRRFPPNVTPSTTKHSSSTLQHINHSGANSASVTLYTPNTGSVDSSVATVSPSALMGVRRKSNRDMSVELQGDHHVVPSAGFTGHQPSLLNHGSPIMRTHTTNAHFTMGSDGKRESAELSSGAHKAHDDVQSTVINRFRGSDAHGVTISSSGPRSSKKSGLTAVDGLTSAEFTRKLYNSPETFASDAFAWVSAKFAWLNSLCKGGKPKSSEMGSVSSRGADAYGAAVDIDYASSAPAKMTDNVNRYLDNQHDQHDVDDGSGVAEQEEPPLVVPAESVVSPPLLAPFDLMSTSVGTFGSALLHNSNNINNINNSSQVQTHSRNTLTTTVPNGNISFSCISFTASGTVKGLTATPTKGRDGPLEEGGGEDACAEQEPNALLLQPRAQRSSNSPSDHNVAPLTNLLLLSVTDVGGPQNHHHHGRGHTRGHSSVSSPQRQRSGVVILHSPESDGGFSDVLQFVPLEGNHQNAASFTNLHNSSTTMRSRSFSGNDSRPRTPRHQERVNNNSLSTYTTNTGSHAKRMGGSGIFNASVPGLPSSFANPSSMDRIGHNMGNDASISEVYNGPGRPNAAAAVGFQRGKGDGLLSSLSSPPIGYYGQHQASVPNGGYLHATPPRSAVRSPVASHAPNTFSNVHSRVSSAVGVSGPPTRGTVVTFPTITPDRFTNNERPSEYPVAQLQLAAFSTHMPHHQPHQRDVLRDEEVNASTLSIDSEAFNSTNNSQGYRQRFRKSRENTPQKARWLDDKNNIDQHQQQQHRQLQTNQGTPSPQQTNNRHPPTTHPMLQTPRNQIPRSDKAVNVRDESEYDWLIDPILDEEGDEGKDEDGTNDDRAESSEADF